MMNLQLLRLIALLVLIQVNSGLQQVNTVEEERSSEKRSYLRNKDFGPYPESNSVLPTSDPSQAPSRRPNRTRRPLQPVLETSDYPTGQPTVECTHPHFRQEKVKEPIDSIEIVA